MAQNGDFKKFVKRKLEHAKQHKKYLERLQVNSGLPAHLIEKHEHLAQEHLDKAAFHQRQVQRVRDDHANVDDKIRIVDGNIEKYNEELNQLAIDEYIELYQSLLKQMERLDASLG